ncbi:uncharacterized protein LOC113377666 [Ctenocephalides felis]|uniref:uncharacterized protein LOC113377666 n=1 Tax=Ctenocephalides felis TaxID=7515 RepID=UPI000E6E209C|nr:uncharacterized protein LOC113377666 [Ctenocephalides felis]
MSRFVLNNINYIQPLVQRRCRICRSVFCCEKCRIRHEQNYHPKKKSILEEMDLCDICSEKTMILIPEKGTDRLIDHITKVHLPVYCRKCLQVFLCRDDLTRVSDRCIGHDLNKHKALDYIAKPAVSSNLQVKDQCINEKKLSENKDTNCENERRTEIDLASDALEASASTCGQSMCITTSTPMAGGFNTIQSPIESPQVSDIASPSSDMELTQGATSNIHIQNEVEKKPGILVKGKKSQNRKKHTSHVKFAPTPIKNNSICIRRINKKCTPRRKFETNPRFLEILKSFETNRLGPKPPSNTIKPSVSLVSVSTTNKVNFDQNQFGNNTPGTNDSKHLHKEDENDNIEKIVHKETPELNVNYCTNCNKHTPATAEKVPSTASSSAAETNDFTPHGIGLVGGNLVRTALTKKFADFKESPELLDASVNLKSHDKTEWFTPTINLPPPAVDEDQPEDSPLDLQDNIFSCENTEENTSGGIWNSVKGVVKNAFINLQSLVSGNKEDFQNFKRSRSVTFESSGVSPRPILKRSRSENNSSPRFLYNRRIQPSMKLKGRKPLRKRL